ncbi:MAG: hypothetical protein ACI9QD_000122 [Thermoproteota archaeon]|jgi:hypothetical protein
MKFITLLVLTLTPLLTLNANAGTKVFDCKVSSRDLQGNSNELLNNYISFRNLSQFTIEKGNINKAVLIAATKNKTSKVGFGNVQVSAGAYKLHINSPRFDYIIELNREDYFHYTGTVSFRDEYYFEVNCKRVLGHNAWFY